MVNTSISLSGEGSINQYFGNNQPAGFTTQNSANNIFEVGKTIVASGEKLFASYESFDAMKSKFQGFANKVNTTKGSPLSAFKNTLTNLSGSWLSDNLGAIGVGVGLFDMLITGGRLTQKALPAPMNFHTSMNITGTMTTQYQISGVPSIPLPGSNNSNMVTATNVLYNKPLGIFNIRTSPIVDRKYFYATSETPNISTQIVSMKLNQNLVFDINPDSDLEIDRIEAAYVFSFPASSGWEAKFINYVQNGYNWYGGYPIEIESGQTDPVVFRTPYVTVDNFKNIALNLPNGSGFEIFLKVKALFRVKNSNITRQPVLAVVKYDFDWGIETNGTSSWACAPLPPKNLTINTDNDEVTLNWTPNTEPKMINGGHYKIYRAQRLKTSTSSLEYYQAGDVINAYNGTIPVSSWTDPEAVSKGKSNLYYKIVAVPNDNLESPFSNVATCWGRLPKTKSIYKEVPNSFDLSKNYPNPFNPETTIKFALPVDSKVKLTIFSMLGQEVKTLVNDFRTAGNYEVKFNASELTSGTYIYRIEAGKFTKTMKMMLLK